MVRSLIAGIVVAGTLVTGAAYAQAPRGGAPGRGAGVGRGIEAGLPLGALNLTDAQRDLIRDIRERHRTEAASIRQKLREAHEAQRKAMTAIPVDETQIRAARLAAAELEADLAVQQARMRNEVFAALTPEQQAQVRKAIADREQRLAQRHAQMQQRQQQRQQQRRERPRPSR